MLQKLVVTMGILALLMTTAAFAQSRIVADVPFDFAVGDKPMPAGQYKITYAVNTPGIVRLKCQQHRTAVASQTIPAKRRDAGDALKLVFNRYGKRHFLAAVSMGTTLRQLPESRSEQELVAQLGRPARVTVLAER